METGRQTPAAWAIALESAQLLQSPETAVEHEQVRAQFAKAAATVAQLVLERGERMKVENAVRDELREAQARIAELEAERHSTNEALSDAAEALREQQNRIAELEAAAEKIRFLHKDSPMGPCPVCVDGDALARGDDPTVPYPCPTARLAGAKDCDPALADGITRRIAPTQALREPGSCTECGQTPEQWCKGCAKCACVDRHDAGCPEDVTPQVTKLRALLAGQHAAVEDPHDGPLHHDYRVGRDLPELGGAR
ncbi:hypothetical protein ACH4UM_18600 [Streptomyces sp. NPDC020801]|uniref:hypothetical protein n=1 Tax=Streptomyces sp. NPDC020801 TaxID=3365093 RepID=UPI0037900453